MSRSRTVTRPSGPKLANAALGRYSSSQPKLLGSKARIGSAAGVGVTEVERREHAGDHAIVVFEFDPEVVRPKCAHRCPRQDVSLLLDPNAVPGDHVIPHIVDDVVLKSSETRVQVHWGRLAQRGSAAVGAVGRGNDALGHTAKRNLSIERWDNAKKALRVLGESVQPNHQRITLGGVVAWRHVNVQSPLLTQRRRIDSGIHAMIRGIVMHLTRQPAIQSIEINWRIGASRRPECPHIRRDEQECQDGDAKHIHGGPSFGSRSPAAESRGD